ncbi:MAG: hypothetical protein Q8S03_10205 [Brevundimonas sp.]|uniref:head-tail joining protein n=1 Tax=Brevundimonas sp. TaxID=1871086 RepID=UPI00273519D5|nr:hypothetical protein [Brevundimonas sp.]MDP3405051.1 hypothetical protein [Brevundimonas sp.]
MSFAGAVDRQQAAIFRSLGEDGVWAGVTPPVRIIAKVRDDTEPFGSSRDVVTARFVRVRKSEVPSPADGDLVTREDGTLLKVIAQPLLDAKRVWTCQVTEVAP